MTRPTEITVTEINLDAIAEQAGRVVVIMGEDGVLDRAARRINRLTKGALARFMESDIFSKMKPGEAHDLTWPAGMVAEAVQVVRLNKRRDTEAARKAGAAIGAKAANKDVLILAGSYRGVADLALGACLRAYGFSDPKTGEAKTSAAAKSLTLATNRPDDHADLPARVEALAEGVFFTRDLVNEPANVLTTTEFANRLSALKDLGLKVKVLEEAELAKLGMGSLLSVGHGSRSPSKVVIMEWMGGEKGAAPLALVGKGVVFDTGGISLKPAGGMEDMTMDMGGAGTVAGVMKTLATRKAAANVVGIVGLVENMPDGQATRPGDVVTSMKGDTIEVINTDAEGRLVLCDIMWHVQDAYKPAGMIDLATLTGAIIVGLGHENAGVFSNDDALCNGFLKAAGIEGEGAWRMPLGAAYDKKIESRIADMKNVGGRDAGSITAAQFLQRFVQDGMPWIHLDIAGVASLKTASVLAPKGATGWGVMALNRLIADRFEG